MKFQCRNLIFFFLAGGILSIWSCSDNASSNTDPNPPNKPNIASKNIGPAGGDITSKDGKLTLTIPEGALGNTETITIVQISPDELGSQFDNVDAENAWELEPEGLMFDKPITVNFETDQNAIPDDTTLSVTSEMLLVFDGETVEPLDSLAVEADADNETVAVSGQLSHFSVLFDDKLKAYRVKFSVFGVRDKVVSGTDFRPLAILTDINDQVTDDPPYYEDLSRLPIKLIGEKNILPLKREIATDSYESLFDYTCTETGSGEFFALTFLHTTEFSNGVSLRVSKNVECIEGGTVEGRVTLNGEGLSDVLVHTDILNTTDIFNVQETITDAAGNYRIENIAPSNNRKISIEPTTLPEDAQCDEIKKTVTVETGKTTAPIDFECFTEQPEAAPKITDLKTDQIGARTFNLTIKGSYTGNFEDHSGVFIPNDGSSKEINLPLRKTEEAADSIFIAENDYTFPINAMLPTESIIKVTNDKTEESDSKGILIEEVTLTVQKDGTGNGTVIAKDPWDIAGNIINCAPDCEEESFNFPVIGSAAGNIDLLATPDVETDSKFIEWSNSCAKDPECTIFLGKQDYTITATFEKEPLPFTADLSINLTHPDTPVLQFKEAPVKIKINNNGPDKATGTSIMLEMSSGEIKETPENFECDETPAKQVECVIGDMEAGIEEELSYKIVVEETGEVILDGNISSNAEDSDNSNNTDEITITVKEQNSSGSTCTEPFDLNGDQVLGLRAFTTNIAGFVISFVDAECAGPTTLQLTEIDHEIPAVDITCDTETGNCGNNNIINGKAHTCSIETTFGNRSFFFECFEETDQGDNRVTAQIPIGIKPAQSQIVGGSRYQYQPTIAQVGERPGCNASFTDSDRDIGLDIIAINEELGAYIGPYSETNKNLLFKGSYNPDNGYWNASNKLPFGTGTAERIINGVWTLAPDGAIDFSGMLSVNFYDAEGTIECEYKGAAWMTNRD